MRAIAMKANSRRHRWPVPFQRPRPRAAWNGAAEQLIRFRETYVVNSSNVIQIYQLIPRDKFDALRAKIGPDAGEPEYGSPFAAHISTFLNRLGMPCWKPPYGTLSSYDLKTGKLLWRHPFGQVQRWGSICPKAGDRSRSAAAQPSPKAALFSSALPWTAARAGHRPQDRERALEIYGGRTRCRDTSGL